MPRRRYPIAGARPPRLGKAAGEFPTPQAGHEFLPEWHHDLGHLQHQSPGVLDDAPAGFEHVALKAGQVEAAAGLVFVFDPQRRHQVEGQ